MKKLFELCEYIWEEFVEILEFVLWILLATLFGGIVIVLVLAFNCIPIFLSFHFDTQLWLLLELFTLPFTLAVGLGIKEYNEDKRKDPEEIAKQLQEVTDVVAEIVRHMHEKD